MQYYWSIKYQQAVSELNYMQYCVFGTLAICRREDSFLRHFPNISAAVKQNQEKQV